MGISVEQPDFLTSEVAQCYDGGYCFKDQHPAMAIAQANSPEMCCASCNSDPLQTCIQCCDCSLKCSQRNDPGAILTTVKLGWSFDSLCAFVLVVYLHEEQKK